MHICRIDHHKFISRDRHECLQGTNRFTNVHKKYPYDSDNANYIWDPPPLTLTGKQQCRINNKNEWWNGIDNDLGTFSGNQQWISLYHATFWHYSWLYKTVISEMKGLTFACVLAKLGRSSESPNRRQMAAGDGVWWKRNILRFVSVTIFCRFGSITISMMF